MLLAAVLILLSGVSPERSIEANGAAIAAVPPVAYDRGAVAGPAEGSGARSDFRARV